MSRFRRKNDDDLEAEIHSHLQMAAHDRMELGDYVKSVRVIKPATK